MSRALAVILIGACAVGCTEGERSPGGGEQSVAIQPGEFTGKRATNLAREIPIPNAGQVVAAHVRSTPVGTGRSSSYVVDFWGAVAASDTSDLCASQKISLILQRKLTVDASQQDLLKDYAVTEVRAAPVFMVNSNSTAQTKEGAPCSFEGEGEFFSAENASTAFIGAKVFGDLANGTEYPLLPGARLQEVTAMPCEDNGATATQCLIITILRNKAAGEEFYADIIVKIEFGADGIGGKYDILEKNVILRKRVY